MDRYWKRFSLLSQHLYLYYFSNYSFNFLINYYFKRFMNCRPSARSCQVLLCLVVFFFLMDIVLRIQDLETLTVRQVLPSGPHVLSQYLFNGHLSKFLAILSSRKRRISYKRFGAEERRLMNLVPAPAVKLMKGRVLSRPGRKKCPSICLLTGLFLWKIHFLHSNFHFLN